MGYRQTFFANTPSVNGFYQCQSCGGWFTKEQIQVDHRIPKKLGGTDDISNLQAMCEHCNKSKGKKLNVQDVIGTTVRSINNGTLDKTITSAIVQNVKNALGIKYKR